MQIFTLPGLKIIKHLPKPKEFLDLRKQIKDVTLVSKDRCFVIYRFAKSVARLDGVMAEVGVYKGGTARILAKTCPHKTLYLFDTFSGMPQVKAQIDKHSEGDFADTSLVKVKNFLADCNNVKFFPGFFPASADRDEKARFCLVHIDVDIYQSVKDSLDFFYGWMVQGGVMILDDYEWHACPGVKKAVSDFLRDKPEKPLVTAKSQCAIIKL